MKSDNEMEARLSGKGEMKVKENFWDEFRKLDDRFGAGKMRMKKK